MLNCAKVMFFMQPQDNFCMNFMKLELNCNLAMHPLCTMTERPFVDKELWMEWNKLKQKNWIIDSTKPNEQKVIYKPNEQKVFVLSRFLVRLLKGARCKGSVRMIG